MKEEDLPLFNNIESKIFTEYKGKIYLGKEEIKPEIAELLKDQARWLLSSQIYEIFKATIINESMNNALIKSQEWDHVLSAKMLYHWQFVLDNVINSLINYNKK